MTKQYQECETLITRIEVRIMRLRREKGDTIKGALQATRDPNAPWLPVRALLGTGSTGAVPAVFVSIFKGEGDFS